MERLKGDCVLMQCKCLRVYKLAAIILLIFLVQQKWGIPVISEIRKKKGVLIWLLHVIKLLDGALCNGKCNCFQEHLRRNDEVVTDNIFMLIDHFCIAMSIMVANQFFFNVCCDSLRNDNFNHIAEIVNFGFKPLDHTVLIIFFLHLVNFLTSLKK